LIDCITYRHCSQKMSIWTIWTMWHCTMYHLAWKSINSILQLVTSCGTKCWSRQQLERASWTGWRKHPEPRHAKDAQLGSHVAEGGSPPPPPALMDGEPRKCHLWYFWAQGFSCFVNGSITFPIQKAIV
jgi:hypothetical protein